MKWFYIRRKIFPGPARLVAGVLLPLLLCYFLFPGATLLAQTVDYKSFADRVENLDRYVDRAARLGEAEAWTNYVELGIGTERIEWEQEALEEFYAELDRIDEEQAGKAALSEREAELQRETLRREFDDAREAWDRDADEFLESERGRYRAEQAALQVDEIAEGEYESVIAAVEAEVQDRAEFELEAWDAAVTRESESLVAGFEADLSAELERARDEAGDLTDIERQAFETELTRIQSDIRRDFEIRESFYLLRARNRYVALARSDYFNARLEAEAESGEAVGEEIVEATLQEVSLNTEDRLAAALEEIDRQLQGPDAADLSDATDNWERKIEAIIDAGLRDWERAEEDLYAGRFEWLRRTEAEREAGEKIWERNLALLEEKRESWLTDVERQITAGRAEWERKFSDFAENRARGEEELARYIETERERWKASSQQLADIIHGGSTALLEVRDAIAYYRQVLKTDDETRAAIDTAEAAINEDGGKLTEAEEDELKKLEDQRELLLHTKVRAFYEGEIEKLETSLASFNSILTSVDGGTGGTGVLHDQMHSNKNDSGLLVDRRRFAGDLPERIRALSRGDFRAGLAALMETQAEAFVLYRRDIDTIIDENELFVANAGALSESTDFDYAAAGSLDDLRDLVKELDREYDDHRRILLGIVNKIRLDDAGEPLDAAARLAAVRSDLDAWFVSSTDEDKRLRTKVMDYFRAVPEGLGAYKTGSFNDPYMLTEAELQWELLRRERNYYSKRMNSARAVKRYADQAFQSEAGLEMAAVTAERAAIAKVRASLKEFGLRLIRGDFYVNPGATAASELERLLKAEYDIDLGPVLDRDAGLKREIEILDTFSGMALPGDTADLQATLTSIDDYLGQKVPADKHDDHPLGLFRAKLIDFQNRLDAPVEDFLSGDDDTLENAGRKKDVALADRWSVLKSGAVIVHEELTILYGELGLADIKKDKTRLINLMGQDNLKTLAAKLRLKKEEIAVNAVELQNAARALEAARDEYRQARIDFDALRSSHSAELIDEDIKETARNLEAVLQRMSAIEASEPFRDAREMKGLAYLDEISAGERAETRAVEAAEILKEITGLRGAESRSAKLEELLAAKSPLPAWTPALANIFLNAENRLIEREAEDPAANSHYHPTAAMDRLRTARDHFLILRAERDALRDAPDAEPGPAAPCRSLADCNFRMAEQAEAVRGAVEVLIAGIRGEKAIRRSRVDVMLGNSPAVDAHSLQTKIETKQKDLQTRILALSEAAATRLNTFLTNNRGKSYDVLLTLLNQQVTAHRPGRAILTNLKPFDDSGDNIDPAYQEFHTWSLVRRWVVASRLDIEAAGTAPDAVSPGPSVSEKWDRLLENVGGMDADADFYAEFQAQIPATADDAEPLRTTLGARHWRVKNILKATNANLYDSFRALTPEERENLTAHDPRGAALSTLTDPVELRAGLERIAHALRQATASFDTNFRALYLADLARSRMRRLSELQPEYNRLLSRLAQVESESYRLTADRKVLTEKLDDPDTAPEEKTSLQDQIDAIDGRLSELTPRKSDLETGIAAKKAEIHQAQKTLSEIEAPGSTSVLAGPARELLGTYVDAIGVLQAGDQYRQAGEQQLHSETSTTADEALTVAEQVAAILGTDGIPDFAAGKMRGDRLEAWAEKLTAWLAENSLREDLDPELVGAIRLLEEDLREFHFAKTAIETRNATTAALESTNERQRDRSAALQEKLATLDELEGALEQAMDDAGRESQDPVAAALEIFDDPRYSATFHLFKGYDAEGEEDLVSAALIQQRVAELRRLADRLRSVRKNRLINAIESEHDELIARAMSRPSETPLPDRSLLRARYPRIKAAAVIAAVEAMPGGDEFQPALVNWLNDAGSNTEIYRGEILSVLATTPPGDSGLSAKILARLRTTAGAINNRLNAAFAANESRLASDRDLIVEQGIADLMEKYAGRADRAREILIPAIESAMALDEPDAELKLATVRAGLRETLETDLAHAAFASLRRDLSAMITAATELNDLETQLFEYLDELENPAPEAIEPLEERIARREVRTALMTLAASDGFTADDYPEELQAEMYVRGLSEARERFEKFERLRASDVAAERGAVVLDLNGLNGSFARNILYADFDAFRASDSVSDFLAGADTPRPALADYLDAYFQDRNTAPELLGGQMPALYERETLREYGRIAADAAGDPAVLNEEDYLADFRNYLLLAKLRDHVERTAFAFDPGLTAAERRAAMDEMLAGFYTDPAFDVDGHSLLERMPGLSQREAFGDLAFRFIDRGESLEDHLPPALAERVADGTLDEEPETASEQLPERPAPVDAESIPASTREAIRAAFAEIDVLRQAGREELNVPLNDAQLNGIVARAGHGDVPEAVRTDLIALLRRHNLNARTAGASSPEEALRRLRADRVLRDIYRTPGAREDLDIFLAAEGERLDSIEEKFFAALDRRTPATRVLAKNQRQKVLRSLIALKQGKGDQDPFFSGLNADLQNELRLLKRELFKAGGLLSAGEKEALLTKTEGYVRVFRLRSGQELVMSGLLEGAERTMRSYVQRIAGPRARAAVQTNSNLALRAFLDAFYKQEHPGAALNAEAAAFLDEYPGLKTSVDRAFVDMDPRIKAGLLGERVLLNRMFNAYMESDAERQTIEEIFAAPALLSGGTPADLGFETSRERVLLEGESVELSAALQAALADHERFREQKYAEFERARVEAERLLEFVAVRGRYSNEDGQEVTRFEDSRFVNYRTYRGMEKKAASVTELKWAPVPGLPAGGVEALLDRPDWQTILKSDAAPAADAKRPTVYTVSNNFPKDEDDDESYRTAARRLYFENLANNYLEAVSRLNAGLDLVREAADLADARRDEGVVEGIRADMKTAYDAGGTGQAVYNKALSDAGAADEKVSAAEADLIGVRENHRQTGNEFARAGRRKLIMDQDMLDYLDNVFKAAQQKLNTAEDAYTTQQSLADTLRTDYAADTAAHIAAMNKMANWTRKFQAANDEFEIRRAVREYAETPYLFATAADAYGDEDDAEAMKTDALSRYNLARAALARAEADLKNAGYQVAIQDDLDDPDTGLAAVMAILNGSNETARAELKKPLTEDGANNERLRLAQLRHKAHRRSFVLSPAEKTELEELTRRDLYARHKKLIQNQRRFVNHALRAVRIRKASDIIAGEVQRRQAEAEMHKQRFEQMMDQELGRFDSAGAVNEEEWNAARNLMYMRLTDFERRKVDMYKEYRRWTIIAYDEKIMGPDKKRIVKYFPAKKSGQKAEKYAARDLADELKPDTRDAIETWMRGGGMIGEFRPFHSSYQSYLKEIGKRDKKKTAYNTTYHNWWPVRGMGFGMMVQGMIMMATLNPYGAVHYALGLGMVVASESKIRTKKSAYKAAEKERKKALAAAKKKAVRPNFKELRDAQAKYEEARAALDYFTKVKDMDTLKERLRAWGAEHEDKSEAAAPGTDLYKITASDLRYLVDDEHDAPDGMPEFQRDDLLDVREFKYAAEYKDLFDNHYDPDSILEADAASIDDFKVVNGLYEKGGDQYVGIQVTRDDGSAYKSFAKYDKTDPPATHEAYDMVEVLQALADHGDGLARKHRDAFFTAGDTLAGPNGLTSESFVLGHRDAVLEDVFQRSSSRENGGREYAGYRNSFSDYAANGAGVFERFLTQRETIQTREWDLRARELQDAYDAWESKMQTILERSRTSFAGAEDRYLQEWRQWSRAKDREKIAGNEEWDRKIAAHFKKKEEWEHNIRAGAAEKTIENVIGEAAAQLDAQMRAASARLELKLPGVNAQDMINRAVEEMRESLPTGRERLAAVNAGIADFNTRIGTANLISGDFSGAAAGLGREFRAAMRDHQQNMKILANVKMFEQIRGLKDELLAQIDLKNQAIEDQTDTAAVSSGFQRSGDTYTRTSELTGKKVHVDAYEWFDGNEFLNEEMDNLGIFLNEANLPGIGVDDMIVKFLGTKSNVEVEAFFKTERLSMQAALTRIMGTRDIQGGDAENTEEIGRFWQWVGDDGLQTNRKKALESMFENRDTELEAERQAVKQDKAAFHDLLEQYEVDGLSQVERAVLAKTINRLHRQIMIEQSILGAGHDRSLGEMLAGNVTYGFGQLGGVDQRRAGSTTAGFYPQMRAGNRELAEAEAEWEKKQGELDPLSTLVNSFNPIVMLANAKNEYDINTRVHGMDEDDAFWGAAAGFGKGVLSAAGSALMASTGLGMFAGVALTAAANMIHVDPATGKAVFGVRASTVANTAFAAGSALVGMSGASSTVQAGMRTGFSAMQSGIRFDGAGNFAGLDYNAGSFAASTAISAVASQAGSSLGKQMGGPGGTGFSGWLGQQIGSQAVNVAAEYGKYKLGYSKGEAYRAMGTPSLERLGTLVGSAGMSLAKDYAKNQEKGVLRDLLISQAVGRRREEEYFGDVGTLLGAGARLLEDGVWGIADTLDTWFGEDLEGPPVNTPDSHVLEAISMTQPVMGGAQQTITTLNPGVQKNLADFLKRKEVIENKGFVNWLSKVFSSSSLAEDGLKDILTQKDSDKVLRFGDQDFITRGKNGELIVVKNGEIIELSGAKDLIWLFGKNTFSSYGNVNNVSSVTELLTKNLEALKSSSLYGNPNSPFTNTEQTADWEDNRWSVAQSEKTDFKGRSFTYSEKGLNLLLNCFFGGKANLAKSEGLIRPDLNSHEVLQLLKKLKYTSNESHTKTVNDPALIAALKKSDWAKITGASEKNYAFRKLNSFAEVDALLMRDKLVYINHFDKSGYQDWHAYNITRSPNYRFDARTNTLYNVHRVDPLGNDFSTAANGGLTYNIRKAPTGPETDTWFNMYYLELIPPP